MQSIFNFLDKIKLPPQKFTMVLCCVSLNLIVFFSAYWFGSYKAETAYKRAFKEADLLMQQQVNKSYGFVDSTQINTLRNQYSYLQSKKDFFEGRLTRFYVVYFAVVWAYLVNALIIVSLLTLIANKGWASTGTHLQALFVTAGALVAFYTSVLGVFRLEENAKNNLDLYLQCKSVQIEIYDFLTTNGRFVSTKGDSTLRQKTIKHDPLTMRLLADTVIHNVNLDMMKLNKVYYLIESNKLPQYDIDKLLKGATAGDIP